MLTGNQREYEQIYLYENLGDSSFRKQNALLHESIIYESKAWNFEFFNAEQHLDVSCVFFLDIPDTTPRPDPTPSAIPMSVGLGQMTIQNQGQKRMLFLFQLTLLNQKIFLNHLSFLNQTNFQIQINFRKLANFLNQHISQKQATLQKLVCFLYQLIFQILQNSQNQFSNTKPFSITDQFSNSDKFSSSFYFSNSEHFTKSYEFTPSATFSDDPTRYSCLVSSIDENKAFILYDRCYFTGLLNKYDISLIRTQFENFVNETDGGAIYIRDTTISYNNSEFINCFSIKGSGGTIYINNSINIKNDVTFDNLTFTNCQATFGGAIMIYSLSELSNISINYCHFYSNKLTGVNMNKGNEFKGGSATFLCARRYLPS